MMLTYMKTAAAISTAAMIHFLFMSAPPPRGWLARGRPAAGLRGDGPRGCAHFSARCPEKQGGASGRAVAING
jgi:hypothetical protein